ncbi:MAG: dienelactone hydrolase family protein [Paraglaciecola sp.]|uniref:dienelactone hydrolase family protein n=1 Tax=Paraglaciecola sp. TaxID=1920173 RepID=UPI003299D38E
MCDDFTENDNSEFAKNGGELSRRNFGKLSAAAIFSLAFSGLAKASGAFEGDLVESEVNVQMPDGVSDSFFVHPAKGTHPGILMWPDIRGLRPAFKAMAKRLAAEGYAVLVVNPFYRDAKAPVVDPSASFSDPKIREVLIPMYKKLDHKNSMSDAQAYIRFIDAQASVDTKRKIGTAGYCMGGPLIMRTAGAVPERVGAAASFHGGGLVTDKPDSPHLLIPTSNAQVLHAIAANDDERSPTVKGDLIEAYKAVGTPAEVEVYQGTLHGWCPPDSPVYNEAQAEKAWARLLSLYKTALA